MKKKLPLLSIAAIIHIIYSIRFYQSHGRQGDHERWGILATGLLVAGGIIAIILDLIMLKFIKEKFPFFITELVLIIIGFLIFYK